MNTKTQKDSSYGAALPSIAFRKRLKELVANVLTNSSLKSVVRSAIPVSKPISARYERAVKGALDRSSNVIRECDLLVSQMRY